ncbi:MAG: hypothetical protein OXN84_18425 [Albidovulum sp.]|nr:hypothetical protein [Albidovulum sp.]
MATFRRVVDFRILSELGVLPVASVDRSRLSELHFGMLDKPVKANHTIRVLSVMFRLAEACGMTLPRRNPCRTVRIYDEAPGEVLDTG